MGKVIVKRDTPQKSFARVELNNGDQVTVIRKQHATY